MLESKMGQLPVLGQTAQSSQDEPVATVTFADALGVVRRQVWVVLTCAIIGVVLGAGFLVVFKPNFTAISTLLIDTRNFQLGQSTIGQVSYDSSAAIESQLELIKSENFALAVIQKLGLTKDPEFVGSGRGWKSTLLGFFFSQPANPPTSDELTARALSVFAKSLIVKRIGNTYAIDIAFDSKYADRAATISNAIADAYIGQQLNTQYNAMRQASDWLESRIQDLRDKSAAGQESVVEYKSQHKIIDLGGGRLADEQRLTEVNSQLTAARSEAATAKARLSQWDVITRQDASDPVLNAPVSEIVKKDDTVSKLRTKYQELASQEEEFSAKFGHDHLVVVNLRKQMQQIRSSILSEFQRLRASLNSDYQLAQQHEAEIRSQLSEAVSQSDAANRAQVALRQLEVSAQTYQGLYDTFLHRYTDALQQQTSPIAEATVITRASPPSQRNFKKALILAAVFPGLGLAFGCGIALMRELLNRVFWTSRSVEASLHMPCFAMIPKITKRRQLPQSLRPGKDTSPDLRTIVRGDRGVSWIVVDNPLTRFTEAFRSIKLAIDLNSAMRANKVVGFTSALSDEGKSTTALAYALHVARTGSRVILVDGDIRNPSLTNSIAPHATIGMMELLHGKATLEEVVCKDPATNLEFIPVVLKEQLAESYEVLASDSMAWLFDELRERYDVVVVDLSPLAPVIDTSATTHLIGSYVFVIEWGATKVDIVEHALRSAPQVHELVIGAILNKADLKRVASYDSHLTGYYSNKHDRRYGLSDVY